MKIGIIERMRTFSTALSCVEKFVKQDLAEILHETYTAGQDGEMTE